MITYEIRSADLQSIFCTFEEWEIREARALYEMQFKHATETDRRHGTVLVRAQWESNSEAEKARLDWLEANPRPGEVQGGAEDGHVAKVWLVAAHSGTLRDALDVLRGKPEPEVVIIDSPEK